MLLAGPPGVGKTLTSESVAEDMRVPLYCMSAGDLGLDPSGIEGCDSSAVPMSSIG
jgi:ATP-dependent Lon protease